jgi:hypothetical protein
MVNESTTEDHLVTKIRWQNRDWICKRDERSLSEVVGYQIASAIQLPLQPWLAFEVSDVKSNEAGLLIGWWETAHWQSCLLDLGEDSSSFVARGLAFWLLGRDEWPGWLLSSDKKDLRLFDLDGTGPLLTVPRHDELVQSYLDASEPVFVAAQTEAGKRGIVPAFCSEVERLIKLDFPSIVDLSGHSTASTLTSVALTGLQLRQQTLARLFDAQ